MPTIFLHLGLHKTGTTFLQRTFLQNRDTLGRHGVLFPETGLITRLARPGAPDSLSGHTMFGAGLRGAHSDLFDALLDSLAREIATENPRAVLLTSETFLEPPHTIDPLRVLDTLGQLGQVKPLIYLRRQDHYAESLYKEMLCWARPRLTVGPGGFVRDFGDRWLDFASRLAPWQACFAPEDLILRSYEDARAGVGLLADVCDVLGLPGPQQLDLAPDRVIYPSLRPDLINVQRAVNMRDDITPEQKKQISHTLRSAPEWVAAPDPGPGRLLRQDQWQLLAAQYGPWNETAAATLISGPATAFRFDPQAVPTRPISDQRFKLAAARALVDKTWPVTPPGRSLPPLRPAKTRNPAPLGVIVFGQSSPEQTLKCLRYHLNLGLARVLLYGAALPRGIAPDPRLTVLAEPAALAQKDLRQRQQAALRRGREVICGDGVVWCVLLDPNEVIYGDIGALLAQAPPGAGTLRLAPAEAINSPDGWHRLLPRQSRRDKLLLRKTYIDQPAFQDSGFWGVTTGKALVHCDLTLDHAAPHNPADLRRGGAPHLGTEAVILRQVCPAFDQWRALWAGYIAANAAPVGLGWQMQQISDRLAAADLDGLRALYDAWFTPSAETVRALAAGGLMARAEIPDEMWR